ncbi:hypothetical protein Barb4_03134 [Bacteroidales bacterium Barb4]|nr:hypothetical protein Barb4_03134 [Bacteroidales bacterium Barb4]
MNLGGKSTQNKPEIFLDMLCLQNISCSFAPCKKAEAILITDVTQMPRRGKKFQTHM